MASLRKNIASQNITFQLNATADGAPVTAGGAGNVVIDGGAQAACTGTFTHKGTGQWNYAPTQAETNGASIGFQFTGTGAIKVNLHFYTDNWDTAQPVVTSGTGTDQLSVASGRIDAGKILGTAISTPATAGILDVNIKNINNVVAATPGATGGLFIAGTNAATSITTGLTAHIIGTVDTLTTYTGNTPQTGDAYARLGAPAGASVSADIAEIEGETDTLLAGVTVTTNNDKTGYSLSASQTFNVIGNITGNLSGSVGSVTGAVGSVTGAVGSVTGAVGSVTGNVGGNVVGTVASVVGNVGGNVVGSVGSISGVTFPTHFSALAISVGGAVTIDGTSALTEAYSTQGSGFTLAQCLYDLHQMFYAHKFVGTLWTILKRDNTTTAKTATVDNASQPTQLIETT